MKSRQFKWWLVLLVVGLILSWQIFLIVQTISEDLTGIDSNSPQVPLNRTVSSIPRIIHQTWKSADLSTYPINNSHLSWKRLYPDYEVRLWTDRDIEQLVSSDSYRHLYDVYKAYPYAIQRADLSRLIILHSQGGIYADLDVFPCAKQVEKIRLSDASFVIPRSTSGSSLINHFLAAQKSSPIINFIFSKIVPSRFYRRIYLIPYLEVFSTGSIFLTRAIRSYVNSSASKRDFVWVLSENEVTDYVTHYQGRSWHSIDGLLLNRIGDHPRLATLILVVLVFSIYCIVRQFNLVGKLIKNK